MTENALIEKPFIPKGFIPWHGGECPVAEDTTVKVKLRNGVSFTSKSHYLFWSRDDSIIGIIAYRIHKPADFRLEDRKYYIDASGRRTRLVRCLKRGLRRGLFHDGGLRLWKADGTAKTADYDIIAVSSNQENKHD
jgi:hypothetical protein